MDIIVFNYFIIRFCDFTSVFLDRKLTIMIKEDEEEEEVERQHHRTGDHKLRSILMGAHTVNRQSIKRLKNSALKDDKVPAHESWTKNELFFDDYDGYIMMVTTYNKASKIFLRQLQLK